MQEYYMPEEYSKKPVTPENPENGADKHITISVAEYHYLTKAATLLEVVMYCESYHRDVLVDAARKILTIEAGAEE